MDLRSIFPGMVTKEDKLGKKKKKTNSVVSDFTPSASIWDLDIESQDSD